MSLSTHVLDTASGVPAADMGLHLLRGREVLFAGRTNADGRCNGLRELELEVGVYRLEFDVADYFRSKGVDLPDPPFLDRVGIDFGMGGEGHYHVPLLVSPYGYSTYRGS
ncbi:hydroxyisourate hydrolase [Asticcacaulis sp. BYS171W]|uniref:5-hydroxyisourate hydrolase n=1 Tax=Asticcacaulis aquaticus TaxID=2984212 RepID=A0ABT5HX60_9CAUL|nr:hydroxyisourate hydrolase [Asticcacaulis aquaticus]MDC7684657.1 hydroxyisourate hydrolase [Asticcacaulis aquaticus]